MRLLSCWSHKTLESNKSVIGINSADLVTLSACDSGINEHRPGDELIGLTRALIYAGTPSVLVSLWTVDELSTSILMREFYRQLLHQGTTKVEALQQAQLHLKTLPVARALQDIERMRSRNGLDAQAMAYVDLTRAEMLLAARDYLAAQQAYQEVLALADLEPPMRRQARAGIEKARAGVQSGVPVHYDRRLYDDPYYWAPFVLVGDWQ